MNNLSLLSFFGGWTHAKYTSLVAMLGSADAIWHVTKKECVAAGWRLSSAEAFIAWRAAFDADAARAYLVQTGTTVLSLHTSPYPTALSTIYDPPPFLFLRGTLPPRGPYVAVVGPRKPSTYGIAVTRLLIQQLAHTGVVIVSGLAHGIDRTAHTEALRQGLYTIAVLGTGFLDQMDGIYHDIANHGALLTEYPPGTPGSTFTFPKRNRIIAGLSAGVLIIEAGEKSGALITAQCAIDNHREVFALPQDIIRATSIGTNKLIQQGAHLVTEVQDILDVLHIPQEQTEAPLPPLREEETAILSLLSREATHIDTLCKGLRKESALVIQALTRLELRGDITHVGAMHYIRIR